MLEIEAMLLNKVVEALHGVVTIPITYFHAIWSYFSYRYP